MIRSFLDLFDPFFELIAGVLSWIYDQPIVGGSLGVAIIILTVIVMTLLSPLTIRATKSSLRMQKLQPEILRVQKEFKNDREQMNQEIFALYKDNGVNPAGACLPLLFQSPVFIILYNVIRGLTNRVDGEGSKYDRTFSPDHLAADSALRADLEQATEMNFTPLNLDLSISARDALQDFGFITSLPFLVLIGAVTATSYYQQRQISGRSTNTEVNPQQKMLLRIMPPFFAVISFTFAAALVLYFFASNLFRVIQQAYITRALYGKGGSDVEPIKPAGKPEKDSTGSNGGGKGNNSKKSDSKKNDSKKSGSNGTDDSSAADKVSKPKSDKRGSGKGSSSGRIGRTRLGDDELPPARPRNSPAKSTRSGTNGRSGGGRVTPSKRATEAKKAAEQSTKKSKKKGR